MPGPGDIATVTQPVVVTGNLKVAGIVVTETGALVFDPNTTTTIESAGNVVIRGGRLVMRPATPSITHTLRFVGIDERRFVGGGHAVLASDVGLWAEGAATLDINGADKTPWMRTAGAVAKGTSSITVAADPIGWQVGDELVIVPTLAPTAGDASWKGYDNATITAITGRTITLSAATVFEHPMVSAQWAPEVLNLSRNTRIEGTPGGRSHIHLNHITSAQSVRNLAIRHMGPRQDTAETYRSGGGQVPITRDVLGRYGFHLHMAGNNSVGTLVENVVVRDTGSHAFVAHESHGVTFRGCISHDTWEDAYWWDPRPAQTNRVRYDSCVASHIRADPPFRGYRLNGFTMLSGSDNVCVNSVAVGVQGKSGSSGFAWPEGVSSVWLFNNNVSHNNRTDGLFVWQNNGNQHVIEQFVAYHNGLAGIEHGAYRNNYQFRSSVLYGNGHAGFIMHPSSASSSSGMRVSNLHIDGAGISQYGMEVKLHRLPASAPIVEGCTVTGHRTAGIAFNSRSEKVPHLMEVVNCTIGGNQFALGSEIPAGSLIRVTNGRQAFVLRRADQAGELVSQWNARRQPATPFTA